MLDRYTLSKMGNIWSEKHKMDIMLKIEVLACEAMCKLGQIPKKSLEKIKKNAKQKAERKGKPLHLLKGANAEIEKQGKKEETKKIWTDFKTKYEYLLDEVDVEDLIKYLNGHGDFRSLMEKAQDEKENEKEDDKKRQRN